MRTEVGPGTEALVKVPLISKLWPRRGSRGARAVSEDPGDHPHHPDLKRLGGKMYLKYHLAVPHLPCGGTEAGARVPPIALNRFNNFLKRGGGDEIS